MNLLSSRWKNIIVILISFGCIAFFLGQFLNPFSNTMFSFHDMTQFARVVSFTNALQQFQIPPHIAVPLSVWRNILSRTF